MSKRNPKLLLADIQESICRIKKHTEGFKVHEFKTDQKTVAVVCLLLFTLSIVMGCQRHKDPYKNWQIYKGDAESTSYSALTQINKENVDQLQLAWTFQPKDAPEGSRYGKYECNPIVIDSVMYVSSARHWIYAVNARTGQKIWSYDPFDGQAGGGVNRGVTYWEKGNDARILFTAGNHLFAVDAGSGRLIIEFGTEGKVNLNEGLGVDPESVWVIPTSPGIVFGDLIIIGGEVSELYDAAPGHIRAYHIETGKLEWIFHTIPHPGEPGYETWPPDAWKYTGGANCWGGMSLDRSQKIVYVPLGSPTYDFYGANRAGKNLYGNSLVALKAETGELVWHFQTVHHDLWDYDLPAPPNLVTVVRDRRNIKAVAQVTKSGFLFVLDRLTGESLFPIEDRPVPSSYLPGEEIWPTQPFPVKPEPYARQYMTEKDLSGFSQVAHDSVLRLFRKLRYEGLFTPPDTRGTLMVPGSRGGAEWGGAAYDPATGVLYINANESPEIMTIRKVNQAKQSESQTAYQVGRAVYIRYCAACHGVDGKGMEPANPPVINLQERLSRPEVRDKIMNGVGNMPAFGNILEGQIDEIMAYLFESPEDEMPGIDLEGSDTTTNYMNVTAYSYFRDPERRPAIKPPWGTLNAIDLNTGDYAWKIPLGNDPELQQEGAPPTGTENWGGPIVTAGGLVFIGATRDSKFRAFEKESGQLLWETTLPGHGFATPCTYEIDGKQYVVIAVTGGREEPGGYIVAFALPSTEVHIGVPSDE